MTSSTTDRRLGLTGGTAIKAPCIAATTAAITLSGEQTIDSVACVSGNRVLVKDQSTGSANGIYVCDSGTWERDLDCDGSLDVQCGTLVFVTNGSANGSGLFQLTTADPITIDSSTLTFTKIATLAASSVTQINVQNGQFVTVGSIAGTNTITGTTVGTAPAANGSGQYVFFIPANTNTGATTFNRDSRGALSVFFNGAALIGGELVQNIPALLYEDGTQYQLIATAWNGMNYQTSGSISSASTLNLDTAKPYSEVTGSTQINAITLGNGRVRYVKFSSTPVIANSASLILPSGANTNVVAGDTAAFVGESGGVVRTLFYQAVTAIGSAPPPSAFTKQIYGLTYANGTDATNDININIGGAMDATGAYWMTLATALGKQSDQSWAVGGTTGSPAGWLDTGAVGNSDYYIWLIARSDTGVVDSLCSLSSTAPTMPANYDYKRLIGWFKRVGGTIVAFTTYEADGGAIDFLWSSPTVDVDLTNTLTTARHSDALKVPLNFSTDALVTLYMADASAALAYVCCPDQADLAPSATVAPLATVSSGAGTFAHRPQIKVRTSATGTVASRADVATIDSYKIVTLGFSWGRRN